MPNDSHILDHLSHSAKFYLEIDEPDGVVALKDGRWEVCRRAGNTNHWPVIGRFDTLREALDLAITPLNQSERRALVEDNEQEAA